MNRNTAVTIVLIFVLLLAAAMILSFVVFSH